MTAFSSFIRQNRLSFLTAGVFTLATFIFVTRLMDPASLPRLISMGLLVVVGFSLVFVKGKGSVLELPPKPLLIAAGVWLLMGAISLFVAKNLPEGVFDWLNLAIFMAFMLWVFQALKTEKEGHKVFVIGLAVAGFIHATIGIFQYFEVGFTFFATTEYPSSTFVNKNIFAETLLMFWPFSLLSFFYLKNWKGALSIIASIVILFAMVLAQSRGVILGIAAAVALGAPLVVRSWFKNPPKLLGWRVWGAYFGTLLVFACVGGYIMSPGKTSSEKIAWITQEGKEMESNMSSVEERLILWNRSFDMAKKHPVLGVGLKNWKVEIMQYGVKGYVTQYATKYFKRPHNDYLWVLCETGILGFLAYLGFLFLPLFFAFKIISKSKDRTKRLTAALMLWGIIGFLVISFFGFPKERITCFGLLLIQVAILGVLYANEFPGAVLKVAKGRIFSALFILLGGFTVFVCTKRVKAEVQASKVMAARTAQNWPLLVKEVDKEKTWFFNSETLSGSPIAWYRGIANFSMGNHLEAEKDFIAARKIHPWHPHVMNNEATTYEVLKKHDLALELYKETLELYPDFEDASLNLTAVYFNLGRHQEALETLCGFEPFSKKRERKQYLDVVKNALGMGPDQDPCKVIE